MKIEREREIRQGEEGLTPLQGLTGEMLIQNLAKAAELSHKELEGIQVQVWRWADYIARTENLSGRAAEMVGVHLGNIYDEQDRMRRSDHAGVGYENERISEQIRLMVGGEETVTWKPLAAELFRKFKKNEHGRHHRNWREMDIWVVRLANGRDFVAMSGLIKPDLREEEWVMSILEIEYQYKGRSKRKLVKVSASEVYTGYVNRTMGRSGMSTNETSQILAALLDQINLSRPLQGGRWGEKN